jgi:hypothetical protein
LRLALRHALRRADRRTFRLSIQAMAAQINEDGAALLAETIAKAVRRASIVDLEGE